MIDLYKRDFKQEPDGCIFVESRIPAFMTKAQDMRTFISKEMGEDFRIGITPGHFVDYGAKTSTSCYKITMNKARGEAMEYWETEYFDLLARSPKEMSVALSRFQKGFEEAAIKDLPNLDYNIIN